MRKRTSKAKVHREPIQCASVLRFLRKQERGERLTRAELGTLGRYRREREAQALQRALRDVRQSMLAELVDVTPAAVIRYERLGMPTRGLGLDKRYDLHQVLPWLVQRWTQGGDATAPVDLATTAIQKAKLERMIESTAMVRAKRWLIEREYVKKSEVEARDLLKLAAVEAALEWLRGRLLELLPHVDADLRAGVIRREVRRLLCALSRQDDSADDADPCDP